VAPRKLNIVNKNYEILGILKHHKIQKIKILSERPENFSLISN
jgi:hypothetical protein